MSSTAPDLLADLGLDDEIRCDTDDCGTRATWWLICQACNHHGALCARCRWALDNTDPLLVRKVAWWSRKRAVWLNVAECDGCHSKVPITVWRALFLLAPIGDGK